MRIPFAAYALVAIMMSSLSQAQDEAPVAQINSSQVPVAGTVDLRSIVSSFSARTHKRFLLDPRVRAEVGLFGIEVRDITYAQLLTIFELHGFFAREQDGLIIVAPDANERQTPIPLVAPRDTRVADAEAVTAIIEVKNLNAAQLVPVLRPLMPQVAQLAAVTDRNALIIADRAGNVRRIAALVDSLDKLPGPPNAKKDE